MLFCLACSATLTKHTNTGKILMKCKCGAEYEGDPEDTLIATKFVVDGSHGLDVLVEYAEYDRVNNIVEIGCTKCNSSHMIQIVTDQLCAYKCEKCHALISPNEIF